MEESRVPLLALLFFALDRAELTYEVINE